MYCYIQWYLPYYGSKYHGIRYYSSYATHVWYGINGTFHPNDVRYECLIAHVN